MTRNLKIKMCTFIDDVNDMICDIVLVLLKGLLKV